MRFNQPSRGATQTLNYEGERAYKLNPALDLYSAVVTSTLSQKFYEGAEDRLERIRALVGKCQEEFVAKLAVYAREQMYFRTIPLVLLVELAKMGASAQLLKKAIPRVVRRADEITELLAYYQQANERIEQKKLNKLSRGIKLGLALAFNFHDEYSFAKYNTPREITFKDALRLVHPKPKDGEQNELFKKIIEGRLQAPYTWEAKLSRLGQQKFENDQAKQEAFRAGWEELVASGKLGYMALMRNLRNILQARVSVKCLQSVCETLADKERVQKAKQFPFRFLSAYRQIKPIVSGDATMILNALEEGIRHSVENLKGFGYDTMCVIACDVSASMQNPISARSVVTQYDIGLVLGMLLQHKCKRVISGFFGDRWKVVSLPQTNILSNADEMHRREGEVGYSTNGYLVIRDLIQKQVVADKVFLFSDGQLWNRNEDKLHIADEWSNYKKYAPDAKLYIFDLSGYGATPISVQRDDICFVAGWSDKVFGVLEALEGGSTAVEEIMKVSF